jgi:hypothetical protein
MIAEWRILTCSLIAWSCTPIAAIGAALEWNAYIVFSLVMGSFLLIYTLVAVLVRGKPKPRPTDRTERGTE